MAQPDQFRQPRHRNGLPIKHNRVMSFDREDIGRPDLMRGLDILNGYSKGLARVFYDQHAGGGQRDWQDQPKRGADQRSGFDLDTPLEVFNIRMDDIKADASTRYVGNDGTSRKTLGENERMQLRERHRGQLFFPE